MKPQSSMFELVARALNARGLISFLTNCRADGISDPRSLRAWILAREFNRMFVEMHERFSTDPPSPSKSTWAAASLAGVLQMFDKVVTGTYEVRTVSEFRALTSTIFRNARFSSLRHADSQDTAEASFRDQVTHAAPKAVSEFTVPNRERFVLWCRINRMRFTLCKLDGMTEQEVADKLGVTKSTAHRRLDEEKAFMIEHRGEIADFCLIVD